MHEGYAGLGVDGVFKHTYLTGLPEGADVVVVVKGGKGRYELEPVHIQVENVVATPTITPVRSYYRSESYAGGEWSFILGWSDKRQRQGVCMMNKALAYICRVVVRSWFVVCLLLLIQSLIIVVGCLIILNSSTSIDRCEVDVLIAKLRAGDLGKPSLGAGMPTVVEELIKKGPNAGRKLVACLEDESEVSYKFIGDRPLLTYMGPTTFNCKDSRVARNATVAVLANYALCSIYGVDFGYYDLSEVSEKKVVIGRWESYVKSIR